MLGTGDMAVQALEHGMGRPVFPALWAVRDRPTARSSLDSGEAGTEDSQPPAH